MEKLNFDPFVDNEGILDKLHTIFEQTPAKYLPRTDQIILH